MWDLHLYSRLYPGSSLAESDNLQASGRALPMPSVGPAPGQGVTSCSCRGPWERAGLGRHCCLVSLGVATTRQGALACLEEALAVLGF